MTLATNFSSFSPFFPFFFLIPSLRSCPLNVVIVQGLAHGHLSLLLLDSGQPHPSLPTVLAIPPFHAVNFKFGVSNLYCYPYFRSCIVHSNSLSPLRCPAHGLKLNILKTELFISFFFPTRLFFYFPSSSKSHWVQSYFFLLSSVRWFLSMLALYHAYTCTIAWSTLNSEQSAKWWPPPRSPLGLMLSGTRSGLTFILIFDRTCSCFTVFLSFPIALCEHQYYESFSKKRILKSMRFDLGHNWIQGLQWCYLDFLFSLAPPLCPSDLFSYLLVCSQVGQWNIWCYITVMVSNSDRNRMLFSTNFPR